MRRVGIALAVLAAATVLAAPGFAFDKVFEQTLPLPSGGSFELHNVNGSVEVSGWNRDEVEIHAVKRSRRSEREIDRVDIEVQKRPGGVAVETHYPHDDGVEVFVEYRIRVPHHVLLDHIATVNGAVRVAGLEGTGDLRTVNGDVEVHDCAGALSAHTTNGDVRLELKQVDGANPLTVETVNGSVVLAVPPGTGAQLEVRSLNGDFRSELPLALESSARPREFQARLGRGGGTVRIRTVNGGIRVVSTRPVV